MNCDTRLTVHHKANHLRCHHCDAQLPIPTFCPECKSYDLHRLGIGTERSESALKAIFPGHAIFRIDRDTTSRKNSLETMLEKIHQGEPAVLVGTQMLAKGHHFSDVTLVAILDADFGLFSSDFRGPEKMGQLLTQVAGRAGRAEKPGRVLIQTHNSDHPLLTTLINKGYEEFAKHLLTDRGRVGLPPFSFFSMIRADASSGEKAQRFLSAVRQQAQQLTTTHCNFVGPLPAVIEKKSNRFHHQLLIQCTNRAELQKALSRLCLLLENHPLAKSVHWSIDVDPVDVF
jgi:primosomal protein N' (replication factor Y)